jgi:serine/threonine protein kinase
VQSGIHKVFNYGKKIGKGATGEVYLAKKIPKFKESPESTSVAIKSIIKEKLVSKNSTLGIKEIIKEVKMHWALQ